MRNNNTHLHYRIIVAIATAIAITMSNSNSTEVSYCSKTVLHTKMFLNTVFRGGVSERTRECPLLKKVCSARPSTLVLIVTICPTTFITVHAYRDRRHR